MSASRPTEPDHDAEESAPKQRQPLTQRTYQTVLDQRIAAAQAEGMFDNLRGAGKPFQFADEALVPEEDRVGYRILKNSGFAPAWIELQKNIREEQASLEQWLVRTNQRWPRIGAAERSRLRTEHQERIVKLNRLIVNYNLVVPKAAGQLPIISLHEQLARLET